MKPRTAADGTEVTPRWQHEMRHRDDTVRSDTEPTYGSEMAQRRRKVPPRRHRDIVPKWFRDGTARWGMTQYPVEWQHNYKATAFLAQLDDLIKSKMFERTFGRFNGH